MLALSFVALAQTTLSELDVWKRKFESAGWTTETGKTPNTEVLFISGNKDPTYLFRFDKYSNGPRRFPSSDPNFNSEFAMSGDTIGVLLEGPDGAHMLPFAKSYGLEEFDVRERISKFPKTHMVDLKFANRVQPLSPESGRILVKALRDNGDVLRSMYGPNGETVEELPSDARVKNGFSHSNIVWLELESKSDPIHVKYPILLRINGGTPYVIFDHANGISYLPFETPFQEIVEIYAQSKGKLWDVWNYYDSNQGQPGLWFRKELATQGKFEVWSPSYKMELTGILKKESATLKGLVFASSGRIGVAQFYNEDGELRFAEFFEGKLVDIKSTEQAIGTIKDTSSASRWWAYNGVSRQFGLAEMIHALYSTRKLAQ